MPKLKTQVPISIGMPYYLLQKVEELAKAQDISRSSFIVQIIKEKLGED